MPDFEVGAAPGAKPAEKLELYDVASDNEHRLPTVSPPTITGKSPATTVGASSKPSTFGEAFCVLGLPDDLHDPLLNMVGADTSSDPSILASIPFDVFRDAVAEDLVLNDGEAPTLFQKGRFFKFFKGLM